MSDVFRVRSWNVNGIRAVEKKGFFSWLDEADADVVGLQETKIGADKLTSALTSPAGWHTVFSSAVRPGYSGVALYSRSAPEETVTALGVEEFDAEGRVILARFGKLWIANVYFPNGSGKERLNERVPYKLAFYSALLNKLESLRGEGFRVLVMGDFNTAHRPIDLARPKSNEKTSGYLPEERAELDRWLSSGYVDTFRSLHPEKTDAYSWWSQRFGVREKNVGWRIDMVYASRETMPFVRAASIHPDVVGSDHCPVGVDLDVGILALSDVEIEAWKAHRLTQKSVKAASPIDVTAKKPAAKKPAAKKPAAKKPAAKKPAAKKPAAKKPAARKPAAKKPAAKKPA